jgi:Flp pilus assembly protein TadG
MTSNRITGNTLDRFRSETGISLIHVAMLVFVFMGFSMFVVDYGVVWLARVQTQNAADAGALAGATARGFDELADPPAANGAAKQSALAAATAHRVFGEVASATVSFVCPAFAPAGVRCTRVDVFRDGINAGSTALPTYFAAAFGNTSQSIKATATAWTANGNSTSCMRPWAVADKWRDDVAPSTEFNHWTKVGNTVVELDPHDTYIPPTDPVNFTGYRVEPPAPVGTGDNGTRVTLKIGQAGDAIEPGWFMAVDLPDGMGGYPSGANEYRDNIGNCVGVRVGLNDKLPTESGNMVGPTSQGVDDLVAKDPGARWNDTTHQIENSCAPGTCGLVSPRIVPVVLFDPDEFQQRSASNDWSGYMCPTGGGCVRVVNMIGFFVEQMVGRDVTGIILNTPAEFDSGKGTVNNSAAFSVVIQLIQ